MLILSAPCFHDRPTLLVDAESVGNQGDDDRVGKDHCRCRVEVKLADS